jgi:hypothetical protein
VDAETKKLNDELLRRTESFLLTWCPTVKSGAEEFISNYREIIRLAFELQTRAVVETAEALRKGRG